ncbi:tandem C2 domains nuclear protein [Brachionichthys hirsutus]|uniref:tandem C2 domains nuclear protein n=1 Tax=Brachionichthys hirsutus TaxID=412623 RepID=UPI003604636B
MDCFKDCCKMFTRKKVKERDTQVITLKIPPNKEAASGWGLDEGRKEVRDDYLISKLPPDGREVPFVLPSLKASYIQPRGSRYPLLQSGPQSSARCTYTERKAELLGSVPLTYSPESSFHQDHMIDYVSPGSARRDTLKSRKSSHQSRGRTLMPRGDQRLSSSMFDLSISQGHIQRFDSNGSFLSSTSSVIGSVESSLDSITLSGDERELGKVCVRLSYQEALEQVWITLVQCSDLNLPLDGVEQQKIGFKGIISISKPIQFKSSIKEYHQDVSFMETFVFALQLQQLRCSALMLRLQTHYPRKRAVAECVLSLRELGSQEMEHQLNLNPPSRSSVCHAELHLTTCFQPVNGRIQLQVLAAQNLPASSSPLAQMFFVKVEMHQSGRVMVKKKTHALKASGGQCKWKETFHFLLAALDQAGSLSVKLYSRSSVRRKQCLGQVKLGLDSPLPEAVAQWNDMLAHPEKVVPAWHKLSAA